MNNIQKNFQQKARRGLGTVKGPKAAGDNIPIKVSAGEAVLPKQAVRALGGSKGVHNLIKGTTGKAPKGLRAGGHYAVGGIPLAEADDLTSKAGLSRPAPVAGGNSSPEAAALRSRLASPEGNTIRNTMAQIVNERPVAPAAAPAAPAVAPAAAATEMLPAGQTPGLKPAAAPAAPAQQGVLNTIRNKAVSMLGGTPAAAPAAPATAAAPAAAAKNLSAAQQLSAAGDAAVDLPSIGKNVADAAKTVGNVPAGIVNGIRRAAGALGPIAAPVGAILDVANDQSATGIAQGAFDVAAGLGAKAGGWMLAPADVATRVTNGGRGLVQTMKDRFTGEYVPETSAKQTAQLAKFLGIDAGEPVAVKGGVARMANSPIPAAAPTAAVPAAAAPAATAPAAAEAAPATPQRPQGALAMDDAALGAGIRSRSLGLRNFERGTGAMVNSRGEVTRFDARPEQEAQAAATKAAQPDTSTAAGALAQAQKLLMSRNTDERVVGAKLMRSVVPQMIQAESARYSADATKGLERARLQNTMRQNRSEAVLKQIENEFGAPVDKDGKPNEARRRFESDLRNTLGEAGFDIGDLTQKDMVDFKIAHEQALKAKPSLARQLYMNWVQGRPFTEDYNPHRQLSRHAGDAGKTGHMGIYTNANDWDVYEPDVVGKNVLTGAYDKNAKRYIDNK